VVSNLSPQEIYDSIVNDFEGAWNSLADKEASPGQVIGRGNFMFANQAMNLLEFAARLCKGKSKMHADFSKELNKIDPKYFKLLPSRCANTTDFVLPHMGNTTGKTLLWALFDLVRNGLAHQYQQIIVKLKDDKQFYVSLARGADHKMHLSVSAESRPVDHLDCKLDESGDLALIVYPDIMFLDFKSAIIDSNLVSQSSSFEYLYWPGPGYYDFNSLSLEKSLNCNKHKKP